MRRKLMRNLLFIFMIFLFSCESQKVKSFYDTLEVSSEEISLDGAKDRVICPHKYPMGDFKKYHLRELKLNFRCHNDYMGGFFVNGKDTAIAQRAGDEGDSWDTQAIFFFDSNDKLILWEKTYSLHSPDVDCLNKYQGNKKKV